MVAELQVHLRRGGVCPAADASGQPPIRVVVRIAPWDGPPLARTSGVRADGDDEADEAYRLSMGPHEVELTAPTREGVFRGLTSLREILAAGRHVPCGVIEDSPRFAWRGLSLDVVRCFHPLSTLLRVIDICVSMKLNVLHLHLTDDEGWRLPVPEWPELVHAGGPEERTRGSYSAADLDLLDQYAADHFVTVVPEIDMPAHSAAAIRAYAGLGEGSILHADSALVDRFARDALAAAARRFPRSAFLHVGGDEAFGMPDEDQSRFLARVAATVRALGRSPVGWQECARAAFAQGDLVQYWMDPVELAHPEPLIEMVGEAKAVEMLRVFREAYAKAAGDAEIAVNAGAKLIASPSARTYLDRPFAADSRSPVQAELRHRLGLPAYPQTPIVDAIAWDPTDIASGVAEDAIAGVEAALWSETVTGRADLEALLLPRLAGIAERAWSPRDRIDVDDWLIRTTAASSTWSRRGWNWYQTTELPPDDAGVERA